MKKAVLQLQIDTQNILSVDIFETPESGYSIGIGLIRGAKNPENMEMLDTARGEIRYFQTIDSAYKVLRGMGYCHAVHIHATHRPEYE